MLHTFDRKQEFGNGLETDCVKVLYYEFDSLFRDEYKSYQYNRMCTILDGEKHVAINNNDRFTYDKSSYILLPPHSSVDMLIEKPTKALVLELSDELITKTGEKISSDLEFISPDISKEDLFLGSNSGSVEFCMKRISHALTNTKERDTKFLMDLYVQELSYFLLKDAGVNHIVSKSFNHPISRAINIMKSNLVPAIQLQDIASELCLSMPAFSRKFKNIVGLSPNAYYTHLKLLKAKELLLTNGVNETAWKLGFENVSHFIRLYKTKFNITPSKQVSNIIKSVQH